MAIEGFDEELSAAEEEALRAASEAHVPPPITSEGEDGEPAPAAQEPAAGEGGEPTVDVNAEADAAAGQSFEDFAAKHKDRSPEDLLRLAFQKEQARRSARYDAKEARKVVTDLRDGLQKRQADRAALQAAERRQFDETLANDPDKAATMAFERQQQREREEAEAAEWQHYVATQTELCERAIPRFREVAPQMMQFGVSRLGYDEAALANAHDSRDLIALYMASQFDRLVQAGIVDFEGRPTGLLPAAAPAAGQAPAQQAPLRQPPRTLSSAKGAGGSGGQTLKDQAADLLAMSDEDFDKAVAAGSFERTVRSLGGGSQ
jgi:hypothetical protein